MNAKTFVIAIVAAVCMPSCDESTESSSDTHAEQRTLNDNTSLWQRSNILSYQYTYRKQCFCIFGEDIVVIVVNGQVSKAFRTPSGIFLTTQELNDTFPIEGLFNKVQEAINQKVASLRVTYNATFGYPETISIDSNQQLADDEIIYTVRNFQ